VKRALIVLLFLFVANASNAQFRPGTGIQPEEKPASTLDAMRGAEDSFISRLFSADRFRMNQTYSLSFMSGGGQSVSMSAFTNTFSYKATDDLFISADVTALYSPYSSLGRDHANSLNGIYLSNARLDWKLSESSFLRISYSKAPYSSSLFDSYLW
jgi:hypothetical protein